MYPSSTKKQDFLNSRDQFIQQTGLERTYWKLLGSPAFQFSYVIGLPVDIQKNLEEYNYGNHVRLGHNLAVKRVFLIETENLLALLSLVSAAGPEVLMAHSCRETD